MQPVDRTKNTPHKSLRAQQICLTHTREHLTEASFSRVDHTVARERNRIVSRKVKDPSFVDLASGLAWLGFVGLGSHLASFAFNARKCTRTRRTHNFALHVSAFVCAVGRLAPFFLDATLPTVLATRFLRLRKGANVLLAGFLALFGVALGAWRTVAHSGKGAPTSKVSVHSPENSDSSSPKALRHF